MLTKNDTILWKSIIGSHLFNMNRPDSDKDYVIVYAQDSRKVLIEKNIRNHLPQKHDSGEDCVYFEIGQLIYLLTESNINAYFALFSDLIEEDNAPSFHSRLRNLVLKTLAKESYRSIEGAAKSNLIKYITGIKEKKPLFDKVLHPKEYQKKLNLIARSLLFGINYFNKGEIIFEPCYVSSIEEINELFTRLKEAKEKSTFPQKVSVDPFWRMILEIRMDKLAQDQELINITLKENQNVGDLFD